MIDAWIDLLIREQPVEKLPPHQRQVGPRRNRRHECDRPLFRFAVPKVLENGVLQPSQHLRDAEFALVERMICAVDRTTHSATFACLPVVAFDKLVRFRVLSELLQDSVLLSGVVVVCN